ncbi:TetR family transcriptional regulator [Rhodococcus hoagii]|uniref:TetR family transcriptional regulator n=1 Tax=Rhodococcus hoagii TaxID=43767 RepID=A0A9Q2S600_RHOHA|nr:TetR family transcriptional regulator [Prescottella equi]MBM4489162.1 TetR family transcriptional regulator [Prescottella equi]MBM4498286.1 TetR family transcriptional regulator [Prescottella equi]MBM4507143.1 TetR family transcriptional regulator [Prescottella equi]MBM4514107.1 TetR family transcriptional regulator [Prescottella equi]
MRSRKKILDATLGLIGSAGFEGVNIAAVAAAAGVTRQTVYSIFGTREDLVSHAIAAPSRCSATSVPGSRPGSRLRAALRRGRPSVVRSEDHHPHQTGCPRTSLTARRPVTGAAGRTASSPAATRPSSRHGWSGTSCRWRRRRPAAGRR